MKVLKGARLIDGTGAGPQPGATVVIRDQRIEAVTTKPAGEWPQDAEIIDVSGMTILPGLIDCHDHMAMHGYNLARRWGIDEPQSTRTLRTAKVLEQTLGMGYTAVRDAAGLDAGFKRAIDEGLISGPRLVVSLCIISPIGGIGDRVSPSGFSCCVPHDPLLPDGVHRFEANGLRVGTGEIDVRIERRGARARIAEINGYCAGSCPSNLIR